MGVVGLVRENIQNSMDGKLLGSEDPVEVIIETGKMKREDIPGIAEIEKHIFSLEGGNKYTDEKIEELKKAVKSSQISYMTFEDRNTKGLKGAARGQQGLQGDTWWVYAYKKGVHTFEEDTEFESIRGGSHGVGKLASNAASRCNLMFFANCDEFGDQHIGGTIQLTEHELDGKVYRSTGYFTDLDQKKGSYIPFENCYSGPFQKNTRGLKLIIPFLREEYERQEDIVQSVCDNFFVSIMEKKLKVKVNDVLIDHSTLVDLVKNPVYYPEQRPEDIKTVFTPLYLSTYMNYEPFALTVEDKNQEVYNFSLYFRFDERIRKGRLAVIRSIGMKIEDRRVKNRATAPYNGVLIPFGSKEDRFLKTLENESHTILDPKEIRNDGLKENAKSFLNNLDKAIREIIKEYLSDNNPSIGIVDTSDVLYSVENSFEKILEKQTETVSVRKRDGQEERNLTKNKIGGGKPRKKRKKTFFHKLMGKRGKNKGQNLVGEEKPVRHSLHKERVRRIALSQEEFLEFNLVGLDAIDHTRRLCDIVFVPVDGIGNETGDTLDLERQFSSALDKNANREVTVDGNEVKGVTVEGGKVRLQLTIGGEYEPSFKYKYYVEV